MDDERLLSALSRIAVALEEMGRRLESLAVELPSHPAGTNRAALRIYKEDY